MCSPRYVLFITLVACGGGGSSTDAATTDAPSADGAVAFDGRALISELVYDPTGADDDEWVEIMNDDSVSIDIGQWRLCGAEFNYYTLPDGIILAPGELIVVHWNTAEPASPEAGHIYTGVTLNPMGNAAGGLDKSMALYTPQGLFDDPISMRDYVQWIEGDQARSDVSAAAGRWDTDDFVPATPEGASICYAGTNVIGPSRFLTDSTPTPLAPNAGCGSDTPDAGVADATLFDAAPDATVFDAPIDSPPPPPTDGDIIINEVFYSTAGDQWIEFKNVDSIAIDISTWQTCAAAFNYHNMPNIVVDPGELIVLHWNETGTQNSPAGHYYTGVKSPLGSDTAGQDQQVAFYRTNDFAVSANIRDYVQWLADNQARSDIAMQALIWDVDLFHAGVPAGHSLCFNGTSTDMPSGFSDDPTPTPLADNGACN